MAAAILIRAHGPRARSHGDSWAKGAHQEAIGPLVGGLGKWGLWTQPQRDPQTASPLNKCVQMHTLVYWGEGRPKHNPGTAI